MWNTNRIGYAMKHLATLLLLPLLLAAAPVSAAPQWPSSGAMHVSQKSGISLDEAVAQVREQTGGRILSAKTVTENGRRIHRIKVLTPDNKVRVISVAAE